MVTLLSTKGFTMTENNKPEWFEIADNDGPMAPPKASKTLPLFAVFAAALIIGVGAVVAQVQEKSPVDPVASNPTQVAATDDSSSPASDAPNAIAASAVAGIASSAVTASATSALKNPSIAQLPTKGDDDDDDDDDDEDDEDDEDGDDD
jgi:hypothetical protein